MFVVKMASKNEKKKWQAMYVFYHRVYSANSQTIMCIVNPTQVSEFLQAVYGQNQPAPA